MLAWDNDIPFHVAEHVTRLRNYRGKSQSAIAAAMGTSQPAIARIESGDENITLRTLQRLAEALSGRIRFAIEPAEANLPTWADWWDLISAGVNASGPYIFRGAAGKSDETGRHLIAGWSAYELPMKSDTTSQQALVSTVGTDLLETKVNG